MNLELDLALACGLWCLVSVPYESLAVLSACRQAVAGRCAPVQRTSASSNYIQVSLPRCTDGAAPFQIEHKLKSKSTTWRYLLLSTSYLRAQNCYQLPQSTIDCRPRQAQGKILVASADVWPCLGRFRCRLRLSTCLPGSLGRTSTLEPRVSKRIPHLRRRRLRVSTALRVHAWLPRVRVCAQVPQPFLRVSTHGLRPL